MKPVFQTIDDPPHGNCMQAAIASILELSLEDVPNFAKAADMDEAINEFLAPFGLGIVNMEPNPDFLWSPSGFHLLYGESPRGLQHVVVAFQGEIVHDPSRLNGGLKIHECAGVIYWLGDIQLTKKAATERRMADGD